MNVIFNSTIKLRHPLRLWRKVHQIYNPKNKEEDARIGRLRILNQYDSGWNFIKRVLVAHMVVKAQER